MATGFRPVTRTDGYAPIDDYAVIGAGRTAALVARDGSIDWLCLPDFDSGSVFGRILDAERGGAFELCPDEQFDAAHRYRDDSNVLETTFRTAGGTARVTDALTLADRQALPRARELVRRVDGLSGSVRLRWRLAPRFEFGRRHPRLGRRSGRPVRLGRREALALSAWGAGDVTECTGGLEGSFTVHGGDSATLTVTAARNEPLVLPSRDDSERRLEHTDRFWRTWAGKRTYDGPWRDHGVRSALVLKLLVYAPSGAVVAAPTTSLPEWIGGPRNWDYRFTWIRDAAYTMSALLRLGCPAEAQAFLWWVAHATALTNPELRVLYALNGRLQENEVELPLAGYRGSRPVRAGNAAAGQTQLDMYGAMLDCVWLYADEMGGLDAAKGRAIAAVADWVGEHWRERDAGIWEARTEPQHFVQSKWMCWVALERACRLAELGVIPDRTEKWRSAAGDVRSWLDEHGWDAGRETFVRCEGSEEVDGSLLTLALFACDDGHGGRRVRSTVDAVRRELADGPLVSRYHAEDSLHGPEGAFLPCSFWLAEALAKTTRLDEAAELMDELVALSNDVGLYSEERGPDGAFLGNFPQALVHLALVNAAITIQEEQRR